MFKDRFDAGEQLAQALEKYKNNPDVVVIAIPRGGLELGYVIARHLHAPLDVIFTKKIGFPGNPEYAIGAASQESVVIDPRALEIIPNIEGYITQEVHRIRELLKTRYQEYKDNQPPTNLKDKIVIVVDDGVATGQTFALTLDLIRKQKPQKIIAALPVSPRDTLPLLEEKADEIVCLLVPETFYSVSQFYKRFNQVEDQDAIRLLHEAQAAKQEQE